MLEAASSIADVKVSTIFSKAEKGITSFTCTVCDHSYTEEIEMIAHVFNTSAITKQPPCSEEGERVGKCSKCGLTNATEKIKKTAHIEGAWIIDVEATCTVVGSKHRNCTTCGTNLETVEIEKSKHTTYDGTCANCGRYYSVYDDIEVYLPDRTRYTWRTIPKLGDSWCMNSSSVCYSTVWMGTGGNVQTVNDDGTLTVTFSVDYKRVKGPYVGCNVSITDANGKRVGGCYKCHTDTTGNGKGTFTTKITVTLSPGKYYITLDDH